MTSASASTIGSYYYCAPLRQKQQQRHQHLRLSQLSLLLLLLLFPQSTKAILPTAAIDIVIPNTNSIITLLASQASFGGQVARYDEHKLLLQSLSSYYNDAASAGSSATINGIGVVPSFPPNDDLYLCNESEGTIDYSAENNNNNNIDKSLYSHSALLVPRGLCSFEYKALSAQRLGASAIIIYGSLSSRYGLNYTNSSSTSENSIIDEEGEEEEEEGQNDAKTRDDYTIHDMIWPGDKYDYDCNFGKALIPSAEFSKLTFGKLPGGYDDMGNDGMLTGLGSEDNLCVKYDTNIASPSTSFGNKCESQRCLVTGRNVTASTNKNDNSRGTDGPTYSTYYEACCAWDLHIWLYGDSSIPKTVEEVTIPAVYVTMQESAELLDLIRGSSSSSSTEGGDPILISVYERYRPQYNISAVLIWAFGVFVAWISSYMSSSEIRRGSMAIEMQRELKIRMDTMDRNEARQTNSIGRRASFEVEELTPSNGYAEERTIYQSDNSSPTSNAAIAAIAIQQSGGGHQDESLELTAAHAAGFLVMSSTSLLILFFFKIYNVVKIMYAFGCSGAFAQIIVHPGFMTLCRKFRLKNVPCLSEAAVTRATLQGGMKGHCLSCLWSVFGPTSFADIASVGISYGVGALWLWVGFTIPHPDSVAFYW